jgi:hypothetical protein
MFIGDSKLQDQIFNLKFSAKQFSKESQKAEKEERAEKLKIKKAMDKGTSFPTNGVFSCWRRLETGETSNSPPLPRPLPSNTPSNYN